MPQSQPSWLAKKTKKDVKQIKPFSSYFSNDCPLGGWPPKGRPWVRAWDIFAPLPRDFSAFRPRDLVENGRTLQSGSEVYLLHVPFLNCSNLCPTQSKNNTHLSIMNFMVRNVHCFTDACFIFENNKTKTFWSACILILSNKHKMTNCVCTISYFKILLKKTKYYECIRKGQLYASAKKWHLLQNHLPPCQGRQALIADSFWDNFNNQILYHLSITLLTHRHRHFCVS
jgi:hypothetical protein